MTSSGKTFPLPNSVNNGLSELYTAPTADAATHLNAPIPVGPQVKVGDPAAQPA